MKKIICGIIINYTKILMWSIISKSYKKDGLV